MDPRILEVRDKAQEALQASNAYLVSENETMRRSCETLIDLEEALRYRNLFLAAEKTDLVQMLAKVLEVLSLRMEGHHQLKSQRLEELQKQWSMMMHQSHDPNGQNLVTKQDVCTAQTRVQLDRHHHHDLFTQGQECLFDWQDEENPIGLCATGGLGWQAAQVQYQHYQQPWSQQPQQQHFSPGLSLPATRLSHRDVTSPEGTSMSLPVEYQTAHMASFPEDFPTLGSESFLADMPTSSMPMYSL